MYFRFSTRKTIQAVAVLLRLARGPTGYLRLLKLLYIADREHLRTAHRPIVGTRTVAMKNGPLHSEVYNLVKGEHLDDPLWSDHIRKQGYQIELVKDPGRSELSAAEVRTLTDTFDRYASMGEWDLVEITHDFPEWLKNYPDESADTSCIIPFDDLLEAVGLRGGKKQAVLNSLREEADMNRLFPPS
jgi:uncharacterized phage-associated protein